MNRPVDSVLLPVRSSSTPRHSFQERAQERDDISLAVTRASSMRLKHPTARGRSADDLEIMEFFRGQPIHHLQAIDDTLHPADARRPGAGGCRVEGRRPAVSRSPLRRTACHPDLPVAVAPLFVQDRSTEVPAPAVAVRFDGATGSPTVNVSERL